MSPSKSTTGIRSSSASVEFDLATVRETRMNTISQMEKKANLLSLPPADGDYISCVLPNGAMYYLRQSNPQGAEKPKDDSNKAQFLSKPMKELLRESEILQSAALLRKADREKRLHSDERVVVASASCGQMWVDKYSPKSFSQLLSSDSTNKEVLKAVKQWDHFVFKRPNPVFHTAPATNTFNNNNSKFKPPQQAAPKPATDSAVDAKEDRGHKEESDSDDDEGKDDANAKTNAAKATKAVVDTRPEYKVILLSGPPGTGKTTLAHIIARHCGYTALEVNASDDRSADSLKELLSRAMTSHSILPNNKPNCLILDEVDGIDGTGAMEALLTIINAPLGGGGQKGGKSKASKSGVCLTRPLICICNDHYTPSLRALRPVAKVFIMDPPMETKLVQRLKNISTSEGLHLAAQSLIELCNATGHDIRSSINTLQFASLKAAAHFQTGAVTGKNDSSSSGVTTSRNLFSKSGSDGAPNARDISSAVAALVKAGLKDGQKNIFDIWQEIFNTKELQKSMANRNGENYVCAYRYVDVLI
jgi:chromosome transmission fidelity protein 18